MNPRGFCIKTGRAAAVSLFIFATVNVHAAETELLDVLLENGVITQDQYDSLAQKVTLTSEDLPGGTTTEKSIDD